MTYYAPTAYNSKKIPEQPAQAAPPKSFSVLDRASSIRLPWGNTKDIAPSSFIDSGSPKRIRARVEFRRKHNEEELEDYHICIDHERYRHASFSFRTLFLGYMAGCGKCIAIWIRQPPSITVAQHVLPVIGGIRMIRRMSVRSWKFGTRSITSTPSAAIT